MFSTQTTNYKRNFIRRFPFSRSFVRVGWHFLVNASLNKVETFFSGRDISETVALKPFCKPFKISMCNAGCFSLLHSIYDSIWWHEILGSSKTKWFVSKIISLSCGSTVWNFCSSSSGITTDFSFSVVQPSAVARPNGQPRQAGVARGVRGHAPSPRNFEL